MPLRLIFMGTPDFAVPTLIELAGAGHEIAAVYTRAPKPAGRGMELQDTPVAREAKRLGLPVLTPKTLRTEEAQAEFAAFDADAAVVVAYGLILPKPVLDAVPLGCFNLHASLLPRWRGAAPINRAVMAGDAESGVTVMKMDEGLDTGGMAMIERVADRPRHDRGRSARPAGRDRRRPDASRARRAGARLAADRAAAGRRRDLCREDRARPRRGSTGRSLRATCTTISAGCRRFRAPGSRLPGEKAPVRVKVLRSTLAAGKRRAGHCARRQSHHRLRRRRDPHRRIAARRQAADEGRRVSARQQAVARDAVLR